MHNFGFDKMHGHEEFEGRGRGRGFGRGPRGPRPEGFEGGGMGGRMGGPGFGPMGGPGFGPMGGPGFGPGFGPMGGPGFRGRPGGRGPGRGRKGDVRNAILALLAEQPMNGYQLISAISDKTQGLWSPSAGSIYPALGLLTDEGLIREVEVDGRKANELTEAGRAYVEEHADDLEAPWDKVTGPHQGFLDVRPEVRQLAMAVQQVVMTGDRDQIEAVRRILDAARRDVYRLLAGDMPAE
ncbi:MAG TPA: PadR family transcriptional regulator [Propionibacteriaceae bacterium]|nr:PadR family transcriptional regulator [Propionibacteriaceae bacterium]